MHTAQQKILVFDVVGYSEVGEEFEKGGKEEREERGCPVTDSAIKT